jgi:hypothetical protein
VTDPTPTPTSERPVDVDTGFWLWVVALPLMIAGYVIDLLTSDQRATGLVLAISLVFVMVLAAVVVTFLMLMRHGYRWARTCLTGGAIASVVYAVNQLFAVERPAAAALGYAAAVIIGSVLIGGGTFLLHRQDAHDFFTR